tara:strand:+ start:262 stop:531 length:270 start_codon:yes stop_codon:yes gene_type:complete
MRVCETNLRTENEILKRILKDGHVLINYDSTDCDGCSSSKVLKYESLESIYKDIEDHAEWADGPFSYNLPLMRKDGTLDLNEDYTGGQW